jgi:hypothetical protein
LRHNLIKYERNDESTKLKENAKETTSDKKEKKKVNYKYDEESGKFVGYEVKKPKWSEMEDDDTNSDEDSKKETKKKIGFAIVKARKVEPKPISVSVYKPPIMREEKKVVKKPETKKVEVEEIEEEPVVEKKPLKLL